MRTLIRPLVIPVCGAVFAAIIGLAPPLHAAGAAPATTPAPPAPLNLAGTGFRDCGPAGLIDDGEDGNNQNIVGADRGGYWYTFRDKKGTTVEPVAGEDGGTFTMSEGGTARSAPPAFTARSAPARRCLPAWG